MKKIVILWTFLLAFSAGHVQGAERIDTLNDINAIKRDTSFIYAESTMKDAVEAQSGAQALLELKLYDWLRSKCPGENVDSLVSESKAHWLSLLTQRGQYNRIFVYVKKQDVLPVVAVPETIIAVDSIAADTLAVLEEELRPILTTDEDTIATIVRFEHIEPYVKSLKADERLVAYGKYATLPQSASCYLFVYDKEGRVVAALRQDTDGTYFNLRTLDADDVRNYKNCGAIWFQLK